MEQLDEPSVVDRREILEDLFDVLLARTRADQQCIRRIDHDIVMQRIHHDNLLAGRLDQAVGRVVEFREGRHDVAVGILRRELIERTPCPDVVPTEIRTPHEDVGSPLQHPVVDRDRRAAREDFLHGRPFIGRGKRRSPFGKEAVDLREVAFERREDALRRPDEDPGIPQVVARRQVAHGGLQIGLLAERGNRRDLPGGCGLDIAVARIGTRRADADRHQRIARLGKLHAGGDVAAELLLVEDEVVGRRHDHRRRGLQRFEAEGRIGDAGGRIAPDGLAQHLLGLQFGELLEHQLPVGGIRHHEEVLRRDERCKTLERMADEALPRAQNIEELLGKMASAGRPEAAADSAGHDDTVAIAGCHGSAGLSFGPHRVLQEILVSKADTVLEFGLVGPAQCRGLRDVKQLARRAVRHRGVPANLARIADYLGNQLGQRLDGQLLARAGIHRLVARVVVHQEDTQIGQVVHVEKLAQRAAVTPARHVGKPLNLGFVEAADQRRKHVAVRRVVVVVRSVEVRRHHADIVRTVLAVQELAILQTRDLGQGISLVGLLQLRSQQARLLHRLGRHARVDARRAEELQLFAAVLPGSVDDVHLEDHVVVHEVGQGALVGLDTADLRRGKEDVFGTLLGKETLDGLLTRQIQLLVRTGNDVRVALTLQFANDGRTYHSTVSGHIDFCILLHHKAFLLILLYNTLLKILGQVHADLLVGTLHGHLRHIGIDHDLHQLLERGLRGVPAQLVLGLRGVAPKVHDIRRTVEILRHLNQNAARCLVDTLLVRTLANELQLDAHVFEGKIAKFPDRVLHTRGDHEILGLLVPQDQPHALDVILRITPVAQRREVAQVEFVLLALGNTGCGKGDLTRHEGLAAALRLVVEQDARAAEHVVGLAVLLDDPIAVEFGHGVGAVGVERGLLVLRDLLHLAVELRGRSLVDAAGLGQPAQANGLQDTQHARCIDVGGELRRIERNLHVALGRKVIDLVGTHRADHLDDAHRVAEIGVVQVEIRFSLQMGDTFAVVGRRTADRAVDVVPLLQQQFSQERAVLACNPSD